MKEFASISVLACGLCLSPGTLFGAPPSFRLSSFAANLYHPSHQQVLEVIGDSINSTASTPRMQLGYRDHLAMPFNGWVVHADSGNSEIGYTAGRSNPFFDLARQPDSFSFCGPTRFSPVRFRDTGWDPIPASGALLLESAVNSTLLDSMPRGNVFGGAHALSARYIGFNSQCELISFTIEGVRDGVVCSSGAYSSAGLPGDEVYVVDRLISPGSGIPALRVRANDDTALSGFGQLNLMSLGTRFRADDIAGVQMQFIAHASWRASDHLSADRFPDDALAAYYRATDPPTHMMLWIGQNLTSAESVALSAGDRSVYRADVRAIMDRHNAVIESLGAPAPRWLLVSQYRTNFPEPFYQQFADAHHDLALADPKVSSLNLYELAGAGNFDRAAYLTDGVHPNAAGVAFLATLMNSALEAAAACPADTDGDGFLTGEDFDGFSAWFILGDSAADFDGDGFVTGDDFDAFVEAFIAGC